MRPTLVSVNFRISAPHLDFYVDVRLRNFGDPKGADCSGDPEGAHASGDPHGADDAGGRWLAVADIAGEREIGLGRSPREALTASLSSLGAQATTALLADPQLIGISGSVMGRNKQ